MESINNELLTFIIDKETYGVAVHQVHEVLEVTPVTKIPRMPDFMKGVINIRGQVVPVIDLRLKFELPEIEDTTDTCIIILELKQNKNEERLILGVIVDSVNAVISINEKDIAPPPKIGIQVDTNFIVGMGKIEEKFITILDIDAILTSEELSHLGKSIHTKTKSKAPKEKVTT